MSPATFSSIIKGVFLFAYAAFLAASISHVAYFFHSFEPVTAGESWWQEWSGPYALAGSIDVTGLVLTVGVTYMRKGVNGFALTVIWGFIFLLTGFSWIANWEYAQQFQSLGLSKAANQPVFFFHVTFGQLNPVLASSFAFLNLAYSIVADFFNARPKTPEEIRTEAEQLQAIAAATKEKKAAQAELRSMNDEGTKRWIKGKLEIIHDVFPGKKLTEKEPSSQVSANPKEQEAPLQSGTQEGRATGPLLPVSPAERGRQNDGKAVATHQVKPIEQSEQNTMRDDGKTGAKTEERGEQNDGIAASDPGVITVLNRYPKINAWLSAGQRTATIEEIVDATGQSKRRVANRVHDGTLKRAPRNAQFILISSVIAWLKTAPPAQQNDTMLREQPAIQLVEKVS